MSKPIQRPSVHYLKDVYLHYVENLLAAHPEWWSRYEKRVKQRHCYIYAKEGNRVVLKMSWFIWKETVSSYFHKAKDAIIKGEALRMGAGVGKIQAIRVERNYNKQMVNWAATHQLNKRNDQGKLIRVFFTDDDYCRIAWIKTGMLTNERAYNFNPAEENTASRKGFKSEFTQALKKDPLLKFRFKYYPLKLNRCNTITAPSKTSSTE